MSDSRETLPSQRAWLYHVADEINALARHRDPTTASWRRVKQAILKAATHLRQEANQNLPPIELDKIKRIRHINEETAFTSSETLDAILSPTSEGFVLRLPKGQHQYRQRFSIAHEIGHTFFYDIDSNPPVRLISQASLGAISPKEEDICSAFARELLMPHELMVDELSRLSVTNKLVALVDLASLYRVSAEVMTRRLLMDLSQLKTTAAIFKRVSNSNVKDTRPYIRTYKGESIRRYLRKTEKMVFEEALRICEGVGPYSALNNVAETIAKDVSIQWQTSATGLRLMVLLVFDR